MTINARQQQRIPLLTNAAMTGEWVTWEGGRGSVVAEASSWGGASIKLQLKSTASGSVVAIDVDATNATLSANGVFNFELFPCDIRILVTGSPTAMYASAVGTHM